VQFRPKLEFLIPLFASMISKNPDERPTIEEVLGKYKEVLGRIPPRQMRGWLGWVKEARMPGGRQFLYWLDYLKLLRHSYRYGFPRDILSEPPTAGRAAWVGGDACLTISDRWKEAMR
jgi:hypothetical protein